MISNYKRQLHEPLCILFVASCTIGLCPHKWTCTHTVWQPRVSSSESVLTYQHWEPSHFMGVRHELSAWPLVVAWHAAPSL